MKSLILLVSLIFVITPSFGQRKIKKLDVVEKGYNIKINFNPIKDNFVYNGLQFKITPISADELNAAFFEESNINGKFEYSYYYNSRTSYFLKKNKKVQEKSDFEFLYSGLEWLLENDKISDQEYNEIEKQLIFYYDEDTGEKKYNTEGIILSNPYYIKDKYLSVFKIEMSNPTNSNIVFDKKINLHSGNTIYNPLSKAFIINELQKSNLLNVDKSLMLEKYNLPDSIAIPPNSQTTKYFAVAPIKYYNNLLEISIPEVDNKLSWEVTKDEKIIDEIYTYYEFNIDWIHAGSTVSYADVFSILTSNSTSIYRGDNELYVGEDSLNEKFELFTLSLWSSTLYFGRNSDLKGIDYIDYNKGRRISVPILLEKISDLKRK